MDFVVGIVIGGAVVWFFKDKIIELVSKIKK